MRNHFWRNTFGTTYIALGGMGFFLPSHTAPEIVVRVTFILLGIALILSSLFSRYNLGVRLVQFGITLTLFWIVFGTALILNSIHNPIYRIHLFYMTFWTLFAWLHYKALRELQDD